MRRKRVPKYIRGGETLQTMKVPRAWLQQEKRAKQAKEQLLDKHSETDAIIKSSLIRSEKQYGGMNGFDIEVYLDQERSTPDLPDAVSGIVVQTEEVSTDSFRQAGCYNAGNFSNYKGGMLISDNSTFGSPGTGTAGYPVSKNGGDYMLSAQHVFADCEWSFLNETFQKSESLGYVAKGSVSGDYIASAVDSNGTDLTNQIQEPDGPARTVSGAASEHEISRRVSAPFDGYTAVGVTTGKTTGGLTNKNYTMKGCNDLRGEGFIGGADGAAGDSGGPMYSVEDGDAYMLGHLSAIAEKKNNMTTCGGSDVIRYNRSIGFPAYEVENDGFTVGI